MDGNNHSFNFSNNTCFSSKNNIFKNITLEELEKKNAKINEEIVNQKEIVKENQKTHINSICELIRMEITIFQKYQEEKIDQKTYIENMSNILNNQKGQYNYFYQDIEKLNYLKEEQRKLSKKIEETKGNKNNGADFLSNMFEDNFSFTGDQNSLRDLENNQSKNNKLDKEDSFP